MKEMADEEDSQEENKQRIAEINTMKTFILSYSSPNATRMMI
jgi:hypothetical protein